MRDNNYITGVRRTSIKLEDIVDGTIVDVKAATQEELIRQRNKKEADIAMGEEKKRRQSLTQHDTVRSELERARNQKDADAASEEERLRRLGADARTTAQEEFLRRQNAKSADRAAEVPVDANIVTLIIGDCAIGRTSRSEGCRSRRWRMCKCSWRESVMRRRPTEPPSPSRDAEHPWYSTMPSARS